MCVCGTNARALAREARGSADSGEPENAQTNNNRRNSVLFDVGRCCCCWCVDVQRTASSSLCDLQITPFFCLRCLLRTVCLTTRSFRKGGGGGWGAHTRLVNSSTHRLLEGRHNELGVCVCVYANTARSLRASTASQGFRHQSWSLVCFGSAAPLCNCSGGLQLCRRPAGKTK